jgi:CRISPR-associated endonuclease Cas3-HD
MDKSEPLDVHLQAVAELAEKFAGKFGAAEWGRVLGLWHDLGKYSAAFGAHLLLRLRSIAGQSKRGSSRVVT